MSRIAVSAFAALLLGGCMTPADEDGDNVRLPRDTTQQVPIEEAGGFQCDASGLDDLIGRKATAGLGTKAVRRAGAATLRWIPPRSAVTLEYDAMRLNIAYDDDYAIIRVTCG